MPRVPAIPRAAALFVVCVAITVVVAGCGSSHPSSAPPGTGTTSSSARPDRSVGSTAPAAPTPLAPTPLAPTPLAPTVTIGRALAVGLPDGWVVERTAARDGSGSVCLQPSGSTRAVSGCAGVAFSFGRRLPGAHDEPYAPNRPDGWYHTSGVELCPFVRHGPTDTRTVAIDPEPGVVRGTKPVGAHPASWNRWTASCAGRTFHPQAWFLPLAKVVAFDYLDHPETASILASAVFSRDRVDLPATPTYLSAHVVSATRTELVVQPVRTYTTGTAARAYAAAHGLPFPFPDDHYDADVGARRTIRVDSSTDCVGGLDLDQDVTGAPVPCSAFGGVDVSVPVGVWLRPGASTAESVSEIFRP